jgi:acyl carrier protein
VTPGTETKNSAELIESWLCAEIATSVQSTPGQIDLDTPFTSLGLSSRQAIFLTARLEDHLEIEELDPALLWDFPTIRKLAVHLAGL